MTPSTAPPRAANPVERVLTALLLAATIAALALFGFLAAQRVVYPHELEWMEGALVDHAARFADGKPIYCAPGPEHVPFLYAPLLFWLGGIAMKCGVGGLFALRAIAAACSVGVAMLIGHQVRKETRSVVIGLVASGLFLAGYGWLWWWYDLARNDSLFVLLTIGCAYQLRHGGPRRWLWAALLAAAAVLAKQSALMWLPAIGVGALIQDWRTGGKFALAGLAAILASLGLLHLTTDGWSTFYLFEMPSKHGIEGPQKVGFWIHDLPTITPLLVLGLVGFVAASRAGGARAALALAAFGSGGLAASYLSRLHAGGFFNVVMYGFAAACVLGPCALGALRSPACRIVALAALALQFGLLGRAAWNRDPGTTALPSAAYTRAHEELLAYVRSRPGDVFMPGHGGITRAAGKTESAHGQAIFDLLQALPRNELGLDLAALFDAQKLAAMQPRTREALVSFRDGMLQAMVTKRYSTIVLDQPIGAQFEVLFALGIQGPDGRPGTDDDLYRRRQGYVVSEPKALHPLIGFDEDSPYAFEVR